MFLIFLNQAAEIVTPTSETFSKIYESLTVNMEFNFIAIPKTMVDVLDITKVSRASVCLEGSDLVEGFIPLGSKKFFKRILAANSLVVNSLAVNASESVSGASYNELIAILCNDKEYSTIDSSSTRNLYPFKGIKYLTTPKDLGVCNES